MIDKHDCPKLTIVRLRWDQSFLRSTLNHIRERLTAADICDATCVFQTFIQITY